jgi:KaiC/GvpD/RAD55 family RecA-like ATPase
MRGKKMEDIKDINVTTIEDLATLEKQKEEIEKQREEIENKIKEAKQALKSRNVGAVTIIKNTRGINNDEEYYSIKVLGTSYNHRSKEIYPRYCSIFSYKTKEESIKYIDQTITCLIALKDAINANEQDKYMKNKDMNQDYTDDTVDTDEDREMNPEENTKESKEESTKENTGE